MTFSKQQMSYISVLNASDVVSNFSSVLSALKIVQKQKDYAMRNFAIKNCCEKINIKSAKKVRRAFLG